MVFATKHLAVLGLAGLVAGCASGTTGSGSGNGSGSGSTTSLGAVPTPTEYQSTLTTLTPSDTVITKNADLPTGSATYYGVANLTLQGKTDLYLGGIELDVDFTAKTIAGDINDFQKIPLLGGSMTDATGTVTFVDTTLTGTNESGVGKGVSGEAEGTIDGTDVDFEVSGGFQGAKGETLSLSFSDPVTTSGGIAFLSE